jgi:hypothetical protein
MLEFEPVELALSRLIRQAGGGARLRLFLGGSPAEWDLEEGYPFRQLSTWVHEGVQTEIVLPHFQLTLIPTAVRNRLASAAEVLGIQIVSDSGTKEGWGLLEAGLPLA